MTDEYRNKDLTTSQAAKLLSVSSDTVLKWVKAGKVKSYRTLGGHYRIPLDGLNIQSSNEASSADQSTHAPVHQYCWEFLAGGGEIKTECKECITYRSRAKRCYELKDLPGEFGCLNLLCDTECSDCEYYKVVIGQGTNVLIVSENKKLVSGFNLTSDVTKLQVKFALDEYEAAVMIQSFRPDYVVVDCALGKKRTAAICSNLFSDIRIPVARIILSSKAKRIRDYCDNEVFGWIQKPFSIEQLKDCIRGVPNLADGAIGK